MTGPWKIIEKLHNGSYKIEHTLRPGRLDKKHASMLSPYPLELIPFVPLDGPDKQFSQIHRPIGKSPFIDASIKGFAPSQPFQIPVQFASVEPAASLYWPSVSELNDELFPFPWEPGEEESVLEEYENHDVSAVMYNGPARPEPFTPQQHLHDIGSLASAIVQSSSKLFFISYSIDDSSRQEWRLVRIAFADSISLHPQCLQDGRFLVEFYILHTADLRFNAANQ